MIFAILGSHALPLSSTVLRIPNFCLLQCQISLIKLGCKLNGSRPFYHVCVTVSTVTLTYRCSCETQESNSSILKWPLSRIFFLDSLLLTFWGKLWFCCYHCASNLFYMIVTRLIKASLNHKDIKLGNLPKEVYFYWLSKGCSECKLKKLWRKKWKLAPSPSDQSEWHKKQL